MSRQTRLIHRNIFSGRHHVITLSRDGTRTRQDIARMPWAPPGCVRVCVVCVLCECVCMCVPCKELSVCVRVHVCVVRAYDGAGHAHPCSARRAHRKIGPRARYAAPCTTHLRPATLPSPPPPRALNPYKFRTMTQHALVAHRPPPALSEPHGTFLVLTRVRRVLAGV